MPLDFPTSPALNQVYSLGGKSWKWNGDAWETYNDNLGVDFVETVNGATGDIGVVGGTDISVSTAGKTLTINYTGSGGGGGGGTNVVTSFNGRTGAVQGVSAAVAGTGISVSGSTGSVTITNTGVLSFNGITGSIQGVSSVNGKTGAVNLVDSTPIYRFTNRRIPGLGEFTIDSSDWRGNTSSGAVKYTNAWFRINALKGFTQDNGSFIGIRTYEDLLNALDSIATEYSHPTFENYVSTSAFLGLVYIKEVDGGSDTEPMQLCIHANGYADAGGGPGTTGEQGIRTPQNSLDWLNWTSGNSGSYPTLFDANFDGLVNSSDAATLSNLGYFTHDLGFTPGGGEPIMGSYGEKNSRLVEGKEYYIQIVPNHSDVNVDNAQRLTYYANNRVSGFSVTSFNGRTGAVQGVSSANGLTGAVTFRAGAGITLSTSGGGISFAIHYGETGAGAPFSIASPTNLDKFLFQDNETGQMRIVSYSTILTKAAQVGEILSTSASYTPNNTNFVVQNTTTGVTEMISANNVFSSIDGGIYDGGGIPI